MPKPFNVFISYSHDDIELRKELEKHLRILQRRNIINVWTDSDISPGAEWEAKIEEKLNSAQIILLLISSSFMDSSFCWSNEMTKAMKRHEANTACVVPIIVRPAMWDGAPFSKLQALPLDLDNRPKPVMSWSLRDEAWTGVAEGIYKIANDLEQTEHFIHAPRKPNLHHLPSGIETRQLKLFISSTPDAVEEQQIVHRVVQQLNQDEGIKPLVQVSLILSNTDVKDTLQAQHLLKPSTCDIVVVICGSQIGASLSGDIVREDGTCYDSQLEWEFEDAARAAKKRSGHPVVFVYRSNQQIQIRLDDPNLYEKMEQWQKIVHFFSRFEMSDEVDTLPYGVFYPYHNLKEFAFLLEDHLYSAIETLLEEVPAPQSEPSSESEPSVPDTGEDILKPYLNWLIDRHRELELRGLGGDVRLPKIPLEKVYVALKGHRATSYEREQSQELLRAEAADQLAQLKKELSPSEMALVMFHAQRQAIIVNPFMPSMTERDRPDTATNVAEKKSPLITLGDAFQQERWMVILGDPGSGKTTLARWIALNLASAFERGDTSVVVPAYQIDPKIGESDSTKIDIGQARLPVLVRVSEFAEAYQKARKNLETLSLADFLGYHTWLGQAPDLPKPKLNALIKHHLREGKAVIILDGMDEITVANQRDDIVRAIEIFIDDWINACGKNLSANKKSALWERLAKEEPVKMGGNQILITSRIVGYHVRPITGQVAHVTVQPMEQVAVEHFCDAWTLATSQILFRHEAAEAIKMRARQESAGLKRAIYDPQRPRVRELASNPLLITILALVYRKNQQRLPEQRVELYSKALDILIEGWRITGMTKLEVTHVLSPVAARIHQSSSNGSIEENTLKEVISEALAQYREVDSNHLPPSFELEVDAFIRRVREDVGLLSERSEKLYGFLHLTFQEYLAALYLIREKNNAPSAAQAIIEKLDDPRWREPILMALGQVSMDWGSNTRQQLLTALLKTDDALGNRIPRSALLIVSAIPEMAQISENIVRDIIQRLLASYADREGAGQFSTLNESIARSLKNLYSGPHQQIFEEYLETAILNIQTGQKALGLAAASLIAENQWYSETLLRALIRAYPYDDVAWNYPGTRILIHQQNYLPVSSETLPMRKALTAEPALVSYIQSNLLWLRLMVLLYGGISDDGLATHLLQKDDLAALFPLGNTEKQRYFEWLKTRDYWREEWNRDDINEFTHQIAIYLDTECVWQAEQARKYIPRFTPQAIINDSPLTGMLLGALRQRQTPQTLKSRLWREWHYAHQYVQRAHALLALLIIDTQPAIKTLTDSFQNSALLPLATMVLNQLRQRKQSLNDALVLFGKKEQIGQTLLPVEDLLPTDQWGDIVDLFFRTFAAVLPRPVHYDQILLEKAPSLPRLNAEIWADWLAGLTGDDPLYSFAVILDTLGNKLRSASALANMQFAHNRKYSEYTRLQPIAIPPIFDTDADIVGDALTVAHQSSSEYMKYLFYTGMILYTGAEYQANSDLQTDALVATLLIPLTFQPLVIQLLAPTLASLPPNEFLFQIVKRVLSMSDPVIRSRALWRLSRYAYYWHNFDFRALAIQSAEQITDPLRRSYAFERLIQSVPMLQREQIKNKALDAARNIADPNNHARALVRLSLYESRTKRWSIMSQALLAIKKIRNEQQLVETLLMLSPYLEENGQFVQKKAGIINSLRGEWYRAKSKGLLSTQLLALHGRLHESELQTPLVLATLIDDLLSLKPDQTSNNDLWRQLLEGDRRPQALSALLKAAAANGLYGLPLTSTVVDVIRSLLETQEITAIYPLLPYLHSVEPSLLSSLSLWVENPPDQMVWAYAGLLLAEAGQVNTSTIPCLIDLIEYGIDIGRYRANIVLHGSQVFVQKLQRDYRTSQLGLEALLRIAQEQKRLYSENRSISTSISWIGHNIVYDDVTIFQQLIEYVNTKEEGAGGVSFLLDNISYCSLDVLEALIQHLENGTEKTQKLLLRSWILLCSYHFERNIPEEMKERVTEAISHYPTSYLDGIKCIPDRLSTILHLLIEVSQLVEEEKLPQHEAISLLNQKLSARTLSLPASPIGAIVGQFLYNLTYDPARAINVAHAVSEKSILLELLFIWLAASLLEDLDDQPDTYYRTSTLLEIAGAVAQFSPAAVINLISKHQLGPTLVQATMYHSKFWGKAGAAQLLGYIHHMPASFNDALLSALHDVAEVQTAVVQTVQNLRYINERVTSKCIDLLAHPSASVVYTVAKLLVSIARDEKTPQSQRQRIVKALNTIIEQPDSLRPIFVLEKDAEKILLRNVGRLDQQLYNDIITIIGII